jgi:hypothetical protein
VAAICWDPLHLIFCDACTPKTPVIPSASVAAGVVVDSNRAAETGPVSEVPTVTANI